MFNQSVVLSRSRDSLPNRGYKYLHAYSYFFLSVNMDKHVGWINMCLWHPICKRQSLWEMVIKCFALKKKNKPKPKYFLNRTVLSLNYLSNFNCQHYGWDHKWPYITYMCDKKVQELFFGVTFRPWLSATWQSVKPLHMLAHPRSILHNQRALLGNRKGRSKEWANKALLYLSPLKQCIHFINHLWGIYPR